MSYKTESRARELEQFLQKHFSNNSYNVTPIQGDAGFRLYFRVGVGNENYILMDCPPSYCSIKPFIEIAHYLRSHSFSAPKIIAFDADQGFIILEDFGNVSVKTLIENAEPQTQKNIYHLIVDILVSLQDKTPPPNLKFYDNDLLLSELSLFEEWYIPHILGRNLTASESLEYKEIWQEILSRQIPLKQAIVLRDYHAENMMFLENRSGINKLGLLDFQDALIGSPIYDLVSVLEDARINVPREIALDCLGYFAMAREFNLDDVLTNYHILGAQRNSRILGVFARKSVRDKNDNYLKYMPLVLKYLEQDLTYPVMAKLREWCKLFSIFK